MPMESLVSQYISGSTIEELKKTFKVSYSTVVRELNKAGVSRRSRGESNALVKSTGRDKVILTQEEDLYWMGLLATDGTISRRNRISLSLKESDREHIVLFKNWSGSKNKIRKVQHPLGICYDFKFSNARLAKELLSLGIKERKSFDLKVSTILSSSRHFWRGAIDGDGCITSSKTSKVRMSLVSASKQFLEQFLVFVETSLGIKLKIRQKSEKLYVVEIAGKKAISILDYLYDNSTCYLKRKYNKFKELTNG